MIEINRRILTLCADTHIGLAAMIGHVGEHSRTDDPLTLRRNAMAVLEQLLKDGLVRAGAPTPDGKAFVAWDLAGKESVARIKREWDNLGRDPRAGDIAWFAATKEGVRTLAAR